MKNWLIAAASAVVLVGCTTKPNTYIPVVDVGGPLGQSSSKSQTAAVESKSAADTADADVVVMIPPDAQTTPVQSGSSIETDFTVTQPASSYSAATPPPAATTSSTAALTTSSSSSTAAVTSAVAAATAATAASTSTPSPSISALSADEQLDGPVLALLTSAQKQYGDGDLNGAAASLERAQRIAPREPQVLYRLAEVRLQQGNPAQAEQLARRGLSYANGRPTIQAGLWELIAKSREAQGDQAGAAQARQNVRVQL